MSVSNYEKLKIVMSEYEILRREASERVKSQLQIYPLALAAISLLFGYVIVNEKYEALLLLPFITILLTHRWIWEVKMVDAIRKYLLKIESEKIPKILGSSEEESKRNDHPKLVGWQDYYEKWRKEQPKDWLFSAILLFGIPTLISILYYMWFLNNSVFHIQLVAPSSLPLIVRFPNILYLLATITYTVMSIWIVWIGIATLREREKERNLKGEQKPKRNINLSQEKP